MLQLEVTTGIKPWWRIIFFDAIKLGQMDKSTQAKMKLGDCVATFVEVGVPIKTKTCISTFSLLISTFDLADLGKYVPQEVYYCASYLAVVLGCWLSEQEGTKEAPGLTSDNLHQVAD